MGFMNSNIIRYDFSKCYHYNEYNKAMDYAHKNLNVAGMSGQINKLENISQLYEQDIKNIIGAEIEPENQKYLQWENMHRIKKICFKIVMALLGISVMCWVLGSFLWNGFMFIGGLVAILMFLSVPALLTAKVGEYIFACKYRSFTDQVIHKIDMRNFQFEANVKKSYREMDALYLQSLEPAHREVVLMRREQKEHQREMERLERERNRTVEEQLKEVQRTRAAQEQLLAIEKEREKRYKGY